MKQYMEAWVEFNGVRCDVVNVRLMDLPKRPVPARQGDKIKIDGRNGYLWKSKRDAYEPIVINVELSTEDGFDVDMLTDWLTGEGWLRFSDEPDRAYKGRVVDEFVRSAMIFGFDKQVFTVPFECQPFRYIYPTAEPVVLTGARVVSNPGTAYSQPRIFIEGTGDMTVNIGEYMIGVTGGSVIVDSETMDCYASDGITLANNRVSMDEYPIIQPGGAVVSWVGNVSRVTIDGRWRSI